MPFTMFHGQHRCAKCKGDVIMRLNGDLYCWQAKEQS